MWTSAATWLALALLGACATAAVSVEEGMDKIRLRKAELVVTGGFDDMTVEAVEKVARGRGWTGADAHARGLVDALGGLRTAILRAKALAGIDEHTKVGLQYLPSASLRDVLRPKPSSQPAAASLTELVGGLAIRSLAEVVDQTQRSLTGVNALWLGESRFS